MDYQLNIPTYIISPPFLTKSKRETNKKSIAREKKNGTTRRSIIIEGVRKERKNYALTSATSTRQNVRMMNEKEML